MGVGVIIASLVAVIVGLSLASTMFSFVNANNSSHTGAPRDIMNAIPPLWLIGVLLAAAGGVVAGGSRMRAVDLYGGIKSLFVRV